MFEKRERKCRSIAAASLFCVLLAGGGCRAGSGSAASRGAPSAKAGLPGASAAFHPVGGAEPGLSVPATQTYVVTGLAAGERRPLLIFLHGLGSSGQAAFDSLGLAGLGARERVFVLAPDGTRDHEGRRFWNAGPACCNFHQSRIDDVARLTQLIETWRARPDIDPAHIYVAGHSNGGFMSELLACTLGGRIAAAASLAGAAPSADHPCASSGRLALLEVHGDADPIVPYAGGTVFDSPELAPYPGIEAGFREWGKRLRCTGAAEAPPALDLDPALPGAETLVQQFRDCAAGSVTLWTVRGGKHGAGTDGPTFEAVWRFLAAH